MKKILIIEDRQEDYQMVCLALSRYAVEIYPKPEEFREFSRIISQYAANVKKDGSTVYLEKIQKQAESFDPDFIFIDLGLDGRADSNDSSGLNLRDSLFLQKFPDVHTYIMSGKSSLDIDNGDYLFKRANATFAAELLNKFVVRHQIPMSSGEQKIDHKESKQSQNSQEKSHEIYVQDPIFKQIQAPEWLDNFKRYKEYKIIPVLRTGIDMLIMAAFYILITGLIVVGPYSIIMTAIKSHLDPLNLAESGFIAFLPLLVVFGFFSFYRRSLQPLLNGCPLDDVDYNRASELMTLSKKLFVSSLISYLFTKFIEMLFLGNLVDEEKAKWTNSFFKNYFNTSQNPFAQVYMIGGAIVALILFYIYLNSHKPSSNKD